VNASVGIVKVMSIGMIGMILTIELKKEEEEHETGKI